MKTYFRKPRDDRLHLLSDYGKHLFTTLRNSDFAQKRFFQACP